MQKQMVVRVDWFFREYLKKGHIILRYIIDNEVNEDYFFDLGSAFDIARCLPAVYPILLKQNNKVQIIIGNVVFDCENEIRNNTYSLYTKRIN